jgi:hypothetical protein
MKKTTYNCPIVYRYEPTKAGAKYSIDGIRYCNLGQLLESIAKAHRGLEYLNNPTTKWNEGSDIESEKASVKSGKASLATIYGESIEAILDTFCQGVASEKFIYMVMIDNQVSEYEMNLAEFREFVERFGRLVRESGSTKTKIQLLQTSHKTIAYLEERVGA